MGGAFGAASTPFARAARDRFWQKVVPAEAFFFSFMMRSPKYVRGRNQILAGSGIESA
jgi:hypothetical protein